VVTMYRSESLIRALLALAGAMTTLAFAPYDYPVLAVTGLAALLAATWVSPVAKVFRRTWWWGAGFFSAGVWWVYISIAIYGQGGPPAGVVVAVLFIAFLACFPAWVSAITARFASRCPQVALLLVWPALWVLFEWVRSWIFTGFPWLSMGYSQSDTPLAGYAPVVGVFGVGAILAWSAAAMVHTFVWRNGISVLVLALVAGMWGGGMALRDVVWTSPKGRELTVATVQANIPQDIKWQEAHMDPTMQLHWDLTREVWRRDLIVWPETAIPRFYDEVERTFVAELRREAVIRRSEMIVGIPYYDFETRKYYNTVMSIGRRHAFYKKSHLVPFGEYLPFRALLGTALDFLGAAQEDYSPSDQPARPLMVAGQPVGVSICYEDAFGDEVRRVLPEATLLVNVSNDGWFGDSIAPAQHLQMARMRALETGRAMVRATNTGISAVIDERGRVVAQSPLLRTHVLTGRVQPRVGTTPYVQYGDAPVVWAAVIMVGVGGIAAWRRRS
jgi:apolipoprotein N-acyltransferase